MVDFRLSEVVQEIEAITMEFLANELIENSNGTHVQGKF